MIKDSVEIYLSRERGFEECAVVEDGVVVEHMKDDGSADAQAGGIYLARVETVAMNLGAAFVDIGGKKNAILPVRNDKRTGSRAALRTGDSVIVEVTREPEGDKGARVTEKVVVPGRYVAATSERGVGVSRKIEDDARRDALMSLLTPLTSLHGFIVRTAAEDAADDDILEDARRVAAVLDAVQAKSRALKPPALLLPPCGFAGRIARDIAARGVESCVVLDEKYYEAVRDAFKAYAPDMLDRLRLHDDTRGLFEGRIDAQLRDACSRKRQLPHGGFVLYEECETLTAIDVNSGTDTRVTKGESGALLVNIEAAREIARGIRLRDIGGIIMIDFIDMRGDAERERVLAEFESCAKRDRSRVHIYGFTKRGLLELTRKKLG